MNSILQKVQKILAKAENTDNENEREVFMAKAQAMMEEHAITMAQVESIKGSEKREPISITVHVPRGVGRPAKGSLAVRIAKSNRCQVRGGYGDSYIFEGMPEDARFAEMLFTSLCLQAEQSYDPKKKPKWTNGRTFRASFMESFFSTVGNRIVSQARERDRERTHSQALVLADVEKRITEKFGKVRYGSRRASSYDSTAAHYGRKAGENANLSGKTHRGVGTRGMIEA